LTLRQAVQRAGGIRSYRNGELTEEMRAVPLCVRRRGGLPLDEMREKQSMTRVVTLGSGKRLRLGQYVAGWKQLLKLPSGSTVRGNLTSWDDAEETSTATVLRQFRQGMHERINRHIPWFGQGREWDRFGATWQFADRVNSRCIVRVNEAPYRYRARLAARLTHPGDEEW